MSIRRGTRPGAACNTCKSSQIPEIINKYGDQYYLKFFEEINSQLKYPIACLDCHDPRTMDLRISRPALIEAFARVCTPEDSLRSGYLEA